MIVLEGPDNSGKSTLATFIVAVTGYAYQGSEGPPTGMENINDRVARYHAMTREFDRRILFDRHPAISQNIYNVLVSNPQVVRDDNVTEFYELGPTIIYCDPLDRGLDDHVEKGRYDTPEHLAGLQAKNDLITEKYREWAVRHAHLVYRIGDDKHAVLAAALSFSLLGRNTSRPVG